MKEIFDVISKIGNIGSFFLWSYVPPIVSKVVVDLYIKLKYGKEKELNKNSIEYIAISKNIHILVISSLFVYSMVEYVLGIPTSYYSTLGVDRLSSIKRIKHQFRQMSISLHPDKNSDDNVDKFMLVKYIYEILSNNSHRALYDCLGPSIVSKIISREKKHNIYSTSLNSYLIDIMLFYLGSSVVFVFNSNSFNLWKVLFLISAASLELHICFRTSLYGLSELNSENFNFNSMLYFWKYIPIYQRIAVMRKLYIYGNMLCNQLPVSKKLSKKQEKKTIEELSNSIEILSNMVLSREADLQFEKEFSLFDSDIGGVIEELQKIPIITSKS